MRQFIVFIVLVAMLAGSGVILASRERSGTPPVPDESGRATESLAGNAADEESGDSSDTSDTSDTAAGAGSSGDRSDDESPQDSAGDTSANQAAGASSASGVSGAEDKASSEAAAKVEGPGRVIRVIAMGWDVLVPGIIANDGVASAETGAFGERGVPVELASVVTAAGVEAALARGGGDAKGADIAIVPLPAMVASYETLRALDPQIFFVVGWSRGRDAVLAGRAQTLADVVRRKKARLAGKPTSTATLMALFVLDLAGIPPGKVKVIEPGDAAARKADLLAVDRSAERSSDTSAGKVLMTTADATDLIPYVAIAPRGFLEKHPDAIEAWIEAWLAGADTMRGDVPGAARKVAAIDGAPKPVELLRHLGQIELAHLGENARVTGLSGRGAVTIPGLFTTTWRLLRGIDVLSTPAPQTVPMATGPITRLVMRSPSRPADRPAVKPNFETTPIIQVRLDRVKDDRDAVGLVGLAAGVFSRSAMRVGVAGSKKRTDTIIDQSSERFGLASARLEARHRLAKKKRSAVIEVLAAP